MEPSNPFRELVKLADAEHTTIEKFGILDLPLEIRYLQKKLKPNNSPFEFYDPVPDIIRTQKSDPNIRSKRHFRNTVLIVIHSTTLFQTSNEKADKENRVVLNCGRKCL